MSEVIATINVEMPSGYEKLSGIEVVKQKDETSRYNGILELGESESKFERRISLVDPLEMWGYDSDTTDWENRTANPKEWWMNKQIANLTERVFKLETQNASALARNTELEEILKERNPQTHTAVISEAETTSEPLPSSDKDESDGLSDKATEDKLWLPAKGESVILNAPQEHRCFGWKTSSELFVDDDETHVTITNGETEKKVLLSSISKPESVVTESATAEPISEAAGDSSREVPTNRWNSLRTRMGNILTGRSAVIGMQTRLFEKNGQQIRITEEVVDADGTVESDKRVGGIAVLGGAALLAAGVIIGVLAEDYFESKHGIPKTGLGRVIHEHSSGNIAGPGSHVDFYNPSPGHRLIGVELPKSLHLANHSGHDIIVDNHGRTVVGRLKDGMFDRQGKLSRGARAILKAKGYGVSWGKLGERFMTIVGKQ